MHVVSIDFPKKKSRAESQLGKANSSHMANVDIVDPIGVY